jgi:hypothetical protein
MQSPFYFFIHTFPFFFVNCFPQSLDFSFLFRSTRKIRSKQKDKEKRNTEKKRLSDMLPVQSINLIKVVIIVLTVGVVVVVVVLVIVEV